MIYYLAMLIFSGKLIYLAIGAAVLSICKWTVVLLQSVRITNESSPSPPTVYWMMQRSINASKIKLGSEYGANKDAQTSAHKPKAN